MTPATRTLIEALLRLAKGMIAETEKWLKAQDVK
jgi:hypothetical protein